MPVLVFASVKGGVGKTTALLSVAGDMALDGRRAVILDADPNGHAARIGAKVARRVGDTLTVGAVTEPTILPSIREAREGGGFVLVDLPGVNSKLTLLGLTRADLVIIPCQSSDMDIHDAMVTVESVRQAGEAAERTIPAAFLLSRWPPAFETRATRATVDKLGQAGAAVLRTPLMERTIFKEMAFNGAVPRVAEPGGNAAANVAALTQELLEMVGEHA